MPPVLLFEADGGGGWLVRVELPAAAMRGAKRRAERDTAWRAGLRVDVVGDTVPDPRLPAVAGSYEFEERGARFVPHLPLVPGLRYRATFDGRALDIPGEASCLSVDFVPPAPAALPPEVVAVFPTADELPENVLRFHVLFSRPMRRGSARAAVRLLDARGAPVQDALYRAPVELWTPDMRRLTVLLDPGRLKRGVGPHRALGPPLATGRDYALEIGGAMAAIDGQALLRPEIRRFRAAAPIRAPVSVEGWSVRAPPPATSETLDVRFPAPMDEGLSSGGLAVVGPGAREVSGRGTMNPDGTRWSFAPEMPWREGAYRLGIGPDVEDVCGNGLEGAFDRPLRAGEAPVPAPEGRSIDFAVR